MMGMMGGFSKIENLWEKAKSCTESGKRPQEEKRSSVSSVGVRDMLL